MGTVLLLSGLAVVVIGTLLPWGASGRAERSSYELVAVVTRLNVLNGPVAALAPLWYFVPLVAAGALVAELGGRPSLARGLGAVMGAAAVGLAGAVLRSPLSLRSGVCVTMVGTVLLGGGVLWRRPSPPVAEKE